MVYHGFSPLFRKCSKIWSTNSNESPQQEGDIKVKYKENATTRVDPDIGEYVDFEEIKDNTPPDESKK